MNLGTLLGIATWVAPILLILAARRLAGRWFNRQHRILKGVLIMAGGFPLLIGTYWIGGLGLNYHYLAEYNQYFYGQEMTMDRYIVMPTPDPGDAIAFKDKTGTERRIWTNAYFSKPGPVDCMYATLKPHQRVRFAETGYSKDDPRPVPTVIN